MRLERELGGGDGESVNGVGELLVGRAFTIQSTLMKALKTLSL